jgi:uncharacterized protein (DUF362 family)
MDRREFLGGLGVGAVWLGLARWSGKLLRESGTAAERSGAAQSQAETHAAARPYDHKTLVVAQGSDPKALIEKGLRQLGGIDKLVKRGSTVVIKPNFSVAQRPEVAATTNPVLVAAVVRQCLAAGAKEVKVIDNPFSGPQCLVISGIKAAVEAAGGRAFNIDSESDFTQVDMGQRLLKNTLFSTDALHADVLINIPILKNHSTTTVTMGLKGMMGLVWDRGYFHSTDLFQTIAELNAYRKPDLVILDAIRGITDNGPTGPGTIRDWRQVIFGVDPVAVDAYGANLFGVNPLEVGYITDAAHLGVGEINIKKLTVKKV